MSESRGLDSGPSDKEGEKGKDSKGDGKEKEGKSEENVSEKASVADTEVAEKKNVRTSGEENVDSDSPSKEKLKQSNAPQEKSGDGSKRPYEDVQPYTDPRFSEAFRRMTDSIYGRPTTHEHTFLFELIGNYIELRDRIRLRVVCLGWNDVVSQKEVYGMFVQTGNLISFFSLKNYFSIFPDLLGFIHDKHFEGGDMVLVSSCQGILCFRTKNRYIVGNHHSEYVALPAQTINHGKQKVVAILCHELGDGDFKLAIAFATKSLNLAFEVYAEGRWITTVSSIKGPHLSFLRRDGLYHNGSAYFLSEWGSIFKFNLATRASFLLRDNALRSDILGVFQNRVCTFRFARVAAGCELIVASIEENVVQCSLKLDWARLKLLPSGCRILTCTKDHNIIIAFGMKIFCYKIHSGVLEPIGSLPEHDKANFVAYSCYDVNEILRF